MRKKILILAFLSMSSAFCYWKIERNLSIDNSGRIVGQTVKQQDIPEEGILQRSLLSYLRQQKENYEKELSFDNGNELSDSVFNFVLTSLWYPQVEKNPVVRMISVAEKSKKLDEIIEILDKCVLVDICLLSRKYTNNGYIQSWNIDHPQDQKTPESKLVYSVISALAIDKNIRCEFLLNLDLGDIDICAVMNTTQTENTTVSVISIQGDDPRQVRLIYEEREKPIELICSLWMYGEDKSLSKQLELYRRLGKEKDFMRHLMGFKEGIYFKKLEGKRLPYRR